MDVRRAFTVSSYALVLTGILSLALAEGTPLTIGIAATFTIGAYLQAEVRGRPFGRLATNLLIFAALAAAPLDHLAFTGDPVLALAHFLIAVQIVKLFGVKAARDYVQLYLISLMHLGVAAILTIDLVFSVAFFVYMVIATWTLILFTLVRELDARGEAAARPAAAEARVGRGLLLGGVLVSAAMFASTAVFFVAFPRFSAILFQVQRRHYGSRVSGFSDEIGLNDLSAIKENEDDVMRVILHRPGDRFPDPPKWRGLAFDRYENGRWKRSWERDRATRRMPGLTLVGVEPAGPHDQLWRFRRPFDRPAAPLEPGDRALYEVLLNPTGTDALFAIPRIQTIQFISTTKPAAVTCDPGDSAIAPGLPQTEVWYRVESAPVPRSLARGAAVSQNGVVDRIDYLAPPAGAIDFARIEALAAEVVAAAGARTPLERAEAIERYLFREYAYALDLVPAPPGVDPVEDFLFAKRRGHCELFASAFVMMARAERLPARLVNGFQSGEWNDVGSYAYYRVRQSDAHAWAEVHFEGVGWVEFDPTPGGGSARRRGLLASWRRVQDYLKLRWMSYVISYNLSDQLSIADRARQRLDAFRREGREVVRRLKAWLPRPDPDSIARYYAGGAAGIAAALAVALVIQRRRARGRGRPVSPRRRALRVPFYEELLRALDAHGWRRAPSETPREFAARVATEGGDAFRPAARVIEAFYAVRFGGRPLDGAAEAEVRAALATMSTGGRGESAERRRAP